MKVNKNSRIVFLVIMIILLIIIIIYFISDYLKEDNDLKNTSNEYDYVVKNATTNSTETFYNDRYSNLTSEQMNEMIEKRNMDKVSISIKEGTLTKDGTIIIITDMNDYPYDYGNNFNIQELKNGKWHDIQENDTYFSSNDFNYKIKENRQAEIQLNWKDRYGELKAGHYKLNLIVSQSDYSKAIVSKEFDIQ